MAQRLRPCSLTGTWHDGGPQAGKKEIFGLVAKQEAIIRCYSPLLTSLSGSCLMPCLMPRHPIIEYGLRSSRNLNCVDSRGSFIVNLSLG